MAVAIAVFLVFVMAIVVAVTLSFVVAIVVAVAVAAVDASVSLASLVAVVSAVSLAYVGVVIPTAADVVLVRGFWRSNPSRRQRWPVDRIARGSNNVSYTKLK